jgi:hypothetical protein
MKLGEWGKEVFVTQKCLKILKGQKKWKWTLGHKISKVNVQFSHLNVPLPIVFTWWREQ